MLDLFKAHVDEIVKTTELCNQLAQLNNINIEIISKHKFLKEYQQYVIAPSCSIVHGNLVLSSSHSSALAIHEICHLLSIEPEYRHMMDVCTQRSYKKINKLYPENKELRSESSTIGLQDIIMKEHNVYCNIYGSFFKGRIGIGSDINQEWIERGKKLYDRINTNVLINDSKIFSRQDNPTNKSRALVMKNCGTILKTNYDNDTFNVSITNLKIHKADILYWAYI